MRLQNQVAIITGGSQGIGQAIYKMRLLNADDTIVATLFESRTNFDTDDENLLLENNHGL